MEMIVVNRSTLCTDDEVRAMTRAVAAQLTASFCSAWELTAPVVSFAPKTAAVNPEAYIVSIVDEGKAGILGYHDELSGAVVDAFVFAGPSLEGGGGKFAGSAPGATTVASVLSHEMLEMLIDPCINTWWDGPLTVNGTTYKSVAAEVGDPVQPAVGKDDFYVCTVDDQEFWLANFILPSWRDMQGKPPYDFLGKLARPFSMAPGGYMILRADDGLEKNEFASRATAATIARSKTEFARRARVVAPSYQGRPR